MDGFWMVVGRGTPTYRHANLIDARAEAERLARLHSGEEFVVVKSVARVVKNDVSWTAYTHTDGNGDDVPF